jgi:hypothetical protein
VPRFVLTIEGPNWKDLDEIELSGPPAEGEPIGTKYGMCLVTKVEPVADSQFAGHITCRLP